MRANLKSISLRCYLFEAAFVWDLTKETIVSPLGCLQGGGKFQRIPKATCLGAYRVPSPHTSERALLQLHRGCTEYKTSMITDSDPLRGLLFY